MIVEVERGVNGKKEGGGGVWFSGGGGSWKGGDAAAPGELGRKVMVEALIWEKVLVE